MDDGVFVFCFLGSVPGPLLLRVDKKAGSSPDGFCWQRITGESCVLLLRRHELNPTRPGLCVCPNAPPASQRSAPGSQVPGSPEPRKLLIRQPQNQQTDPPLGPLALASAGMRSGSVA